MTEYFQGGGWSADVCKGCGWPRSIHGEQLQCRPPERHADLSRGADVQDDEAKHIHGEGMEDGVQLAIEKMAHERYHHVEVSIIPTDEIRITGPLTEAKIVEFGDEAHDWRCGPVACVWCRSTYTAVNPLTASEESLLCAMCDARGGIRFIDEEVTEHFFVYDFEAAEPRRRDCNE